MARKEYIVRIGSEEIPVTISEDESGRFFEVAGKKHRVEKIRTSADGAQHLLIDGKGEEVFLRRNGTRAYRILARTREREVLVYDAAVRRLAQTQGSAGGADEQTVRAPIPGSILKVFVEPGDDVEQDQPLVILEAMKMQNEILSPVAGRVSSVHVQQGQTVLGDTPMVVLTVEP